MHEDELRKSHDAICELRVQERTEALRRQADLLELAHNAIFVRDMEEAGSLSGITVQKRDTAGQRPRRSVRLPTPFLGPSFPCPLMNIWRY